MGLPLYPIHECLSLYDGCDLHTRTHIPTHIQLYIQVDYLKCRAVMLVMDALLM